jgi:HK97 family phage major capsid protein
MTTAVPAAPHELEEMLGDPDQIKDLLADPKKFKDAISGYVAAVKAKDTSLDVQLKELMQAEMAKFLKDNALPGETPVLRPNLAPAVGNKGQRHNPNAPGAALDAVYNAEFGSAGEFFRAVYRDEAGGGSAKVRDQVQKLRNASQMGSAVPGDGGFLVPEVLRAQLLRLSLETAVVRSRAMVIPMDSLRVPFPAIDSTTNSGSNFGGVTCYWTSEGSTLTASIPQFGRIVLDAKKFTAYTAIPNELVQDSVISVDPLVNEIFPTAMGFQEDYAYINGAGAEQPAGVLNANAMITQAKETSQVASTIVWENVVKMYSRMLPQSIGSAVWLCSPDTLPQLYTMGLAVGTGGGPIFMGFGDGPNAPSMSLLGRPLIVTEKVPALGSQGQLAFLDFSKYLIGDRMAMSAARSTDYLFGQDMIAYRIIQRLDGRPWVQSAITPANGSSNTLSPYVQLAA